MNLRFFYRHARMAGLVLATTVYALSYFVIGIACQYRYLYAIDLSAIAALVYVAADHRGLSSLDMTGLWRRRSNAGQ